MLQDKSEIAAIGHRTVHGGEAFANSVRIDDQVIQTIRDCSVLAPLHNPHNLKGIDVDVGIVHRRDRLRAESALIEDVERSGIPIHFNRRVLEIHGDKRVEALRLADIFRANIIDVTDLVQALGGDDG